MKLPAGGMWALGLLALTTGLQGGVSAPVRPARAQPAVDTFVGTLSGLDAFVAVVSDGTGLLAYVCDGASNTLAEDFAGSIDQAQDGVVTLKGEKGTILQLNIDATMLPALLVPDAHITGTVLTTDGHSYPFSTDAAVPPAGLYHADQQTVDDGSVAEAWWVRISSGAFKGSLEGLPGAGACAADFQNSACLRALGIPLQGEPGYDETTFNLALSCLFGAYYFSAGSYVVGFPVWSELLNTDPLVAQQLLRQVDQQPSAEAVSNYQSTACISPTPNAEYFTDRGYPVPPIYLQPGGSATAISVPMALTPTGGSVVVASYKPNTPPNKLKVHKVKKEEAHHNRP